MPCHAMPCRVVPGGAYRACRAVPCRAVLCTCGACVHARVRYQGRADACEGRCITCMHGSERHACPLRSGTSGNAIEPIRPAPPSGKSSRSTEVMTTCAKLNVATASATCCGSRGSTAFGRPVATLQKAQARVQIAPRIIIVACFFCQHSPRFGHAASSHTVCRLLSRISFRVSATCGEVGAFARIQAGFR